MGGKDSKIDGNRQTFGENQEKKWENPFALCTLHRTFARDL
jgi:hypothetical protein